VRIKLRSEGQQLGDCLDGGTPWLVARAGPGGGAQVGGEGGEEQSGGGEAFRELDGVLDRMAAAAASSGQRAADSVVEVPDGHGRVVTGESGQTLILQPDLVAA
jgi:hypothetical protein